MTRPVPTDLPAEPARVTTQATLHREGAMAFVELLFFAYRDFISDPDAILKEYGFGRAHHRVLHFVGRHPGIRVAALLDVLQITKQSLAPVLRQLMDQGFVMQEAGRSDRRQRRIFVTVKGRALAESLAAPQIARINDALEACGPSAAPLAEAFLSHMITAGNREGVRSLIEAGFENEAHRRREAELANGQPRPDKSQGKAGS